MRSFIMALGMFSIIPVPKNSWNDKYLRFMMPCLPIVGAVIGLAWYWLTVAMSISPVPYVLRAAITALIPFVLSGFLHLDGYIDTADAVFSRRGLEEKRRILKDPHLGAFGAVALCCLFLLQFCAVSAPFFEGVQAGSAALIFIPIVSRCVGGIAMLNLKSISESSYSSMFKTGVKPRHTIVILLEICAAFFAAYWCFGVMTLVPLGVVAVIGLFAAVYVYRQFKGFSGDLCGCIITVSELAGLLCLAVI